MIDKTLPSTTSKLDTPEKRQLRGVWLWLARESYIILFLFVLYSDIVEAYDLFGFTQRFLSPAISEIHVTKKDNNQFEVTHGFDSAYAKNYFSGIEDGDLILSIDGIPLTPDTTEETANDLLKGTIGEQVDLTVRKSNGNTNEYTVVRLKALVDVLNKFHLTPQLFFWSLCWIVIALLFSTTLVSVFIFRVRTTDWMVILVATTILLLPFTSNDFYIFLIALGSTSIITLVTIGLSFGSAVLLITMYVFPDGQFHPVWAKWALIPIIIFTARQLVYAEGPRMVYIVTFLTWTPFLVGAVVAQIYKYKKTSTFAIKRQIKWWVISMVGIIIVSAAFAFLMVVKPYWSLPILRFMWMFFFDWQYPFLPFIWIFLLIGAAVSQIYKYKKISTLIEKQQLKWTMMGTVGIIIVLSASELLQQLDFYWWTVHASTSVTMWEAIFNAFRNLILTSLLLLFSSITFAISIYRFRLWDADFYINRAFIYGLVTAILAIVWTITVALLQFLLQQFTDEQSPLLAAVLSGIQVAALFTPVRTRVEKWVNDRFYKDRINFMEAIVELQAEKWQFISSRDMFELLVAKTPYLIKSTCSAIYLEDGSEFDLLSTYGVDKNEVQKIEISPKNLELLKKGKVAKMPDEKPFALLVPLTVPRGHINDLVGILALGPRKENRGYSRDHISDLTVLGKNAGIAIHFLQLNEKKMLRNVREMEIGE
jgi:hypothetical protein